MQHTGELKADLDLNQVWVFGTPRQGMALPGLDIEIAADGSLTGLPPHVKVRHYS